ncbi:MAG TPA: hypothetical protein VJW73_17405 [Gemmatimonadaceae bacterium]|nr:hypothetical protein [Gemmatimonadaceae bacterium]
MSGDQRPPIRAPRRTAIRREASAPVRSAARADAVREIERELEAWRSRVVPEPSMPLEADDVARLVGDCLTTLGLDEAASSSFTINTVHFYRRKEILDAPEGRTSAARYTVRHLWQAVGARLAGQLGLLTLAEARDAMSGRSERVLLAFVAERVLDARARQAARRGASPVVRARPLTPASVASGLTSARPLVPSPASGAHGVTQAMMIALPGDAWCVVPRTHPAHRSEAAARALGRALGDALAAASVDLTVSRDDS